MYVQALPQLSFMEAFKIGMKKYCTFRGRARRSEYWLFSISCGIINSVIASIFSVLIVFVVMNDFSKRRRNYYDDDDDDDYYEHVSLGGGFIFAIVLLVIFEIVILFPLISAGVRRLHDTGRSGCYYLLALIPFGSIVLLIFFIEDSQQNTNEYGPSPKYVVVQNDPLINNNSQVFQVNGIPGPNNPMIQGYPAVIPGQQYPPVIPNQQYPQVQVQENLYQGPVQPNPSNQEQISTPVVSP